MDPTRMMTILWMIRHGETAWNAEGRVQGQTDVALSEVGAAQAEAIARALAPSPAAGAPESFAAVYSSDLRRASETASPCARALGLAVRLEPRLRERHYGLFETLTYAEAKVLYPEDYARFKAKEPDYDFRSGESLRAFHERALQCIAEIAARHAGSPVLVFTHGGVLDSVYRHATGRELSARRDFPVPNAALNLIEITAGEWRVLEWADCAHLQVALDDLPD